jgi:NDP-sugar pyrophosphorylase family protein
MILAAGKSTRLGELTARLPKPMLPIGGRPILGWTLDQLRESEVTEVVINLHHAAEAITEFLGDGSGWGIRITYLFEPHLLGTSGAVKNAQALLSGGPFLLVYGDNVLDWDPRPMIQTHCASGALATIAVAERDDVRQKGVVRFDPSGEIRSFVEKPGDLDDTRGWENAGVYVLGPGIFDHIPPGTFSDFGYEVLPNLIEQGADLRAFRLSRPPFAIDTPEEYRAAQSAWDTRGRITVRY